MCIVEFVIVEFEVVELELVELEAANTGETPAALIKMPSNNSPLALIFTKDESVFLYISNWLKLINFWMNCNWQNFVQN